MRKKTNCTKTFHNSKKGQVRKTENHHKKGKVKIHPKDDKFKIVSSKESSLETK